MFKIIGFKRSHLKQINSNKAGLDYTAGFPSQIRLHLEEFYEQGPSRTVMWNDEIIACGGIIYRWPAVGRVWMRMSEVSDWGKKKKARFKNVAMDAFNEICLECDYKTLTCEVDNNFEAGKRFVEFLGFKFVGVAEGYMPGGETDGAIYTRRL